MITVLFLVKIGIVFLLSMGLNYLLVKYQRIINIFDIPNARSVHLHVKPRSGGIAIFSACLMGFYLCDLQISYLFIVPLSLVFVVGLCDDIWSVSSKRKLIITALAAISLYFLGFDIQHFGTFFGHEVILNVWFSVFIVAFGIAGFVSALNLIDGLDGLASLVSVMILLPFAYMGFKYTDPFLFYFSSIVLCAIFGFLMLNWHPAKLFMGDSGSMMLGFTISIVVVYAIQKDYITAISVLLLCAVPILDTLIVILRRVLHHQHPFHADKTHIHHIILKQQFDDTRKTVLLIGLMQMLFSYLGLGFKVRDDIVILGLYILCFILFYFILTPDTQRKDDAQ